MKKINGRIVIEDFEKKLIENLGDFNCVKVDCEVDDCPFFSEYYDDCLFNVLADIVEEGEKALKEKKNE